MFNEAFWFFYWVGVVGYLTTFFSILGAVSGIVAIFVGSTWVFDREKRAKPWFISLSIVGVLFISLAILTPTTTAMYAGAGQHVAQMTEVDETLLRLKELVDAKIEEQLPKQD